MFLNHHEQHPLRTTCWALTMMVCLAGCHQEMANQPRVAAYDSATFFADGSGIRPQVQGTIARGQSWQHSPELTGKSGKEFVKNPHRITAERLARGQELFGINCQHCHGLAGNGDGMVVQRGFPRPPSYHIDRLRDVPDGRIFEVITQGHGRMPALGRLIAPEERWSIVWYVRALQLSQHAPEADLTDADHAALSADLDERSPR